MDIPLIASGSINDSVKTFLDASESKKHPQQVEWSDLSDLPGGKYPTSFQYAFSVDLSERQDFRLCLGANKYSEFGSTRLAQRLTKSLGYVFGAIKIRAGGPAGQLRELEAKPEAMILHCGRSIMGGHFVTLILDHGRWVLLDNDKEPQVLEKPEVYLKENKFYPYLVHYRFSSIEEAGRVI